MIPAHSEWEFDLKKSELLKAIQQEILRHDLDTFLNPEHTIVETGCPACQKPFMGRPENVLAGFGLTRVWALRRYPVNSNTPPVPDRVAFLPGNNVGRIFV